jgi:peptidoglycan/LPS O-acetylase OafA/YrhL
VLKADQLRGVGSLNAKLTFETKGRYLALDGLRGVAALFVVLYHIRWTNHVTDGEFVKHGYLAVDLFFILSGFIISAGYSRKITDYSGLQRFICLRLFRVYPLHFAVLLAFVTLELAKLWAQRSGTLIPGQEAFTDGNSLGALVANVVLVHSLGVLDQLSWNYPSWSISCEFVAYLVFSIGVLAGLFRSKLVFTIGAVLASIGYMTLVLMRGTLDITYDWGLVRCLSGFFFGMTIFELSKGRTGERLNAQSTAMIGGYEVALLTALVLVMSFASGAAIVLIIPIFIGAVAVLQLDRGPIASILKSAPAQLLGCISYSIYMVHFLIIVVLFVVINRIVGIPVELDPMAHTPIIRIDPWIGDSLVIIVLLLVVGISASTYALIEQPARLFGRRLAKISFRIDRISLD